MYKLNQCIAIIAMVRNIHTFIGPSYLKRKQKNIQHFNNYKIHYTILTHFTSINYMYQRKQLH